MPTTPQELQASICGVGTAISGEGLAGGLTSFDTARPRGFQGSARALTGRLSRVERPSHQPAQLRQAEWFRKIRIGFSPPEIVSAHFAQVPAGKNDFQRRPRVPQPLCQLEPVHPAGHHNVGNQKVDRRSVLAPDVDRTRSTLSLEQTIAETFEQLEDECAYAILVFDDENRLFTARDRRHSASWWRFHSGG